MVERHVRNVEVGGSSPLTSTKELPGQRLFVTAVAPAKNGSGARRAREIGPFVAM